MSHKQLEDVSQVLTAEGYLYRDKLLQEKSKPSSKMQVSHLKPPTVLTDPLDQLRDPRQPEIRKSLTLLNKHLSEKSMIEQQLATLKKKQSQASLNSHSSPAKSMVNLKKLNPMSQEYKNQMAISLQKSQANRVLN